MIDIENSLTVQAEFQAGLISRSRMGKGASKGLPFTLFDDIKATSKEWLTQDFLGVGEISCWYGSPGEGKSVLAEDHALHVAAGMEWLDRKVKQGAGAVHRP